MKPRFLVATLSVIIAICAAGSAAARSSDEAARRLVSKAHGLSLWPLAPFRSNGTQSVLLRTGTKIRTPGVSPRELPVVNPLVSMTDPPPECPPCFNCLLSKFECLQFGTCSPFDGHCVCPPGYGGDDCSVPSGQILRIALEGIFRT